MRSRPRAGALCARRSSARSPGTAFPRSPHPGIFKRIKEETIRLKDEGRVVLRMADLKLVLEIRMGGDPIEPQTLEAVILTAHRAGAVCRTRVRNLRAPKARADQRLRGRPRASYRTSPMSSAHRGIKAPRRRVHAADHRINRDDETVVLQAMLATLLLRRALPAGSVFGAGTRCFSRPSSAGSGPRAVNSLSRSCVTISPGVGRDLHHAGRPPALYRRVQEGQTLQGCGRFHRRSATAGEYRGAADQAHAPSRVAR